jgi:putative glutathione S-transferase
MTSGATTSLHSRVAHEDVTNNYYLISSKSCPYAHRTEIVKNIKLLPIQTIYCDPAFKFSGWSLDYDYNGVNPSKIFNCDNLIDLYKICESTYNGRGTLPLLINVTTNKIVNNESSEIIKIFNSDFNSVSPLNQIDLYPENLKQKIDDFCTEFNREICTNTYKAGHAKTLLEYGVYFDSVFNYLDKLDKLLTNDYIVGNQLTLADIHAYPHLIRFDSVFYTLFSLNKKHLWEYPNICSYLKRLSANPCFSSTVDLNEFKKGFMCENNYAENLGCKKIPLGNGGSERYFL